MIHLQRTPIDTEALVASASVPAAGAVVLFVGITREYTEDRQTTLLVYEAYPEMAKREMEALEQEARQRWALCECALTHRLGPVGISEASVAIVVSASHRRDAFAAGQWLIDQLKTRVPIWKKEHWANGASSWIHPNGQPRESPPHG